MKPFAGEVSFPISRQEEFRTLAEAFVREQNPDFDASTLEFSYILDAFTSILVSTAHYIGEWSYIVAHDYNFIANQYDVSQAITIRLASRNLPRRIYPLQDKLLREDDRVRRQGYELSGRLRSDRPDSRR